MIHPNLSSCVSCLTIFHRVFYSVATNYIYTQFGCSELKGNIPNDTCLLIILQITKTVRLFSGCLPALMFDLNPHCSCSCLPLVFVFWSALSYSVWHFAIRLSTLQTWYTISPWKHGCCRAVFGYNLCELLIGREDFGQDLMAA